MSERELFVNNNGKVLSTTQMVIEAGNRGYTYGDGLFESMRIMNGNVLNLANHYARLEEGAKVLKMRLPAFFLSIFFKSKLTN